MAKVTLNTDLILIENLPSKGTLELTDLTLIQDSIRSYKLTYSNLLDQLSQHSTLTRDGTSLKINDGGVNTNQLASSSINNIKVSPNAAILGTKIDPRFGTQDITTDGKILPNGSTSLGNASAPHYSFGSDTDTGIFRGGVNELHMATGGVSRFSVASDGKVNVGGGLNTGDSQLSVTGGIAAFANPNGLGIFSRGDIWMSSATPTLRFVDTDLAANTPNATVVSDISGNNGNLILDADTNGLATLPVMQFNVGGSYKGSFADDGTGLRLNSNTDVNVTTGTNDGMNFKDNNSIHVSKDGGGSLYLRRRTSAGQIAAFYNDTTLSGSITVNGGTATYTTTSDYRLKENILHIDNSIDLVKRLKPSMFNFISDPSKTYQGFIAHELQEVVPQAVTGEKDKVDDKGNPEYQGVDSGKVVPVLTAALQDAITKIEELESRIAQLESK